VAELVTYETEGRVAIVTLNRPEARNAVDPGMDVRLREIWSSFAGDDTVDVAIWTGAGEAFCAGADRNTWFAQWVGATAADVRRNAAGLGFGGLTRGLHRMAKPVIAAVNGWALGGGLELALACDIRIASDRARFGSPLVGLGFHHGDGGISRLVDICGLGVALDVELTGQIIDAQQALYWGLVTRVVSHDQLMTEARTVAEQIVGFDQSAIRSAKRTTLDVIGHRLDDQLEREAVAAYSLDTDAGALVDRVRISGNARSGGPQPKINAEPRPEPRDGPRDNAGGCNV
jgi:enoyl-CoA hydratase/carnithine racemase